ncbi:reverse transcriptase domain-containing protein [Tanacetum coccineum]
MDGCTKDPQLEEGENQNTGAPGTERTPPGGTFAPAGKVTSRRLFNKGLGGAGSENSQMSPSACEAGGYSSDGSSRSRSQSRSRTARKHQKSISRKKRSSKSHQSVRSETRSTSKSKSVKSKPRSVRASRRKSSSDSGYDTIYHRRAKLPANVRVYEGNKDPDDHLSIFSTAAEQEKWPMPVWCKMFRQTLSGSARNWLDSFDPKSVDGFKELSNKLLEEFSQQKRQSQSAVPNHGANEIRYINQSKLHLFQSTHIKGVPPVLTISAFMHGRGHPKLDKKLNDKIPKTIDEMWERSASKAGWSKNQNGSRNRGHGRGQGRSMGTCALYAREEGFTPLTKTPNEILAMDNVNFPPPPPIVGNPEKQNMNKFCDSHQDRGHNTNDCYHLKKQTEEAGYHKRTYERVGHGMDNAIAFPSVPGYQLMNCPVVIDAMIEGFRVRRIYVDGGSSLEIMYEHCFRNLDYRTRSRLKESRIPLVGFLGEVNYPLGVIDLEVTMGEYGRTRTVIMEFTVVKSPSPYNDLLGRTGLRSLGVVASTIHSMIKFPTSNMILTVATTRETLRECRQIEEAQSLSWHARVTDLSPMQTSSKVANPRALLAPVKTRPRRPGNEPMQLDDVEERQQHDKGRKPPKSSVEENIVKKRSLAPDRKKVVTDEVNKWLKAGIVKRVRYPSWVSNPVLVKKVDGSCRMCIDFKDLNKACPKDLYPLPEIDWKIESLIGFKYKRFFDAYKGYHQIQVTKKDEEKTAFHTEEGVFCYTKMPFGLKNDRATYQRLVDSAFKEEIEVNLEAYIDDMVIKSQTEQDIIRDVEQTFSTLWKINMKLNPKKCLFGMEERKFLGYVVTSKGIRANPKKTKAVIDMPSPRTLKQMQSLRLQMDRATEAAFLEMKKLVSELPTLTTPKKGETLMIQMIKEILSSSSDQGLEVGSIWHIQGLDTAYWGFLGVGTTFDILQNIHILYIEYGVLSISGYNVLNFTPLWSLVSAGTDTPYLL